MGDPAAQRMAIVTVHGTGDTAEGPDGEKWFQNGSAFVRRLKARLGARGIEADIAPHLWSGANSASERERGAVALAKALKELAKTHARVHVVGHSHGGNVAIDAAGILGWSAKRKRRQPLASIATVGTPFFKTKVSWTEWASSWVFFLLVAICVPTILYFLISHQLSEQTPEEWRRAIASYESGLEMTAEDERALLSRIGSREPTPIETAELERIRLMAEFERNGYERELLESRRGPVRMRDRAIIGGASVLALVFTLPLALTGIRRTQRARRRRDRREVFSIWHPSDEAIAFLQRVDQLQLEPFPRGSILRGSRTGAVIWGVRLAILVPIACAILVGIGFAIALGLNIGREALMSSTIHFGPILGITFDGAVLSVPIILGYFAFIGAPFTFVLVYFTYRTLSAVVGELAMRGALNRMVGGSLQGITFGRDGGNQIGDVASTSHYYATKAAVLEGEVADRMLASAAEATRRLFDKYRGGLFSVDFESGNAVAEMAQDAMTWDSLIHTIYFDQPEVADMIGDYIAQANASR